MKIDLDEAHALESALFEWRCLISDRYFPDDSAYHELLIRHAKVMVPYVSAFDGCKSLVVCLALTLVEAGAYVSQKMGF